MSTLTVSIGGTSVPVIESSLKITARVDDKNTCTFTVYDESGTATYQHGQTVSVVDTAIGTLFTGYVNKPIASKLYPNPAQTWQIDCVSQFYNVVKKASKKRYKKRKAGSGYAAGAIAANQIQQYLAPDGVVGNFSLSWTEQQTEWKSATLNNTVAAANLTNGNPNGGNLELASGGSQVVVTGKTNQPGGTTVVLGQAAGLKLTGYASSGYASAYTNRQIWSGSLPIASTSDQFGYDVWVDSSSPAIKAGCDFICSDGTVFSSSGDTDFQFLSPSLGADLSGLANDQWYSRYWGSIPPSLVGKTIVSVVVGFNSAASGTYTAYFRRIAYISGGTTILFFSDNSTLQKNVQVNNIGYTNVSLTQVQVSEKSALATCGGLGSSGALSVGAAGVVQSSQMNWTAPNIPNGCTILRETSIDNGATWQTITSGSAIPNLLPGMVITGRSIWYRDTFTVGQDPTVVLSINTPTLTVNPSYASTKTDSLATFTSSAQFNSGILTNLATIGSSGITLNGVQENWDDGDFSNQPEFGNANLFQQVENKQFILQTDSGTDAKSQLLFAGQWQNFTAEVDVTVFGTVANAGGFVYRTTGWQGNNDTYAYCVMLSETNIQLGRGTNSSTGAGAFTSIANVSINLAANTVHRLKVIANGSNHQVFVDGILLINATDATYGATGYLGLRIFNNTGSTQSCAFDNFGVCSALSGTWQSPTISIAGATTYGNSAVFWDIDGLPDSTTSITAQTSIDGGATWQSVSNGGAISGLSVGQSLAGKTLILKLILIASNAPVVPTLNGVTAWIMGQYSSSGTRSNAPLLNDTMQRANVVSGFGTSTDNQTYTQIGTGPTNLTSNEAQISNTTGDVHMQAGTFTWTDEQSSVRFRLSASTISAGIELRYVDANNYYRLVATLNSLSIVLCIRGVQVTLATATPTITPGTWYGMRFQLQGSGPINFSGRVWPDGSGEPTEWNVSATQ